MAHLLELRQGEASRFIAHLPAVIHLIDIVQAGARRGQRHHVNAVEHLETVHPLDRFRLRDAITAAQPRHPINL